MSTEALPALVADAGLGKLVTYLRLAGFDTIFDPAVPDADRLLRLAHGERTILTCCRRVEKSLRSSPMIFIVHDRPDDQMRQVLSTLKVKRCDLIPLNRCSRCNRLLKPVPRSQVIGSVPDHVAHVHRKFFRCAGCNRVYWPGSHTERWMLRIDGWFGQFSAR